MKSRILLLSISGLILFIIFIFIFITGNHNKNISVVSDLAYNRGNSENEVYIYENGSYVPYIVITDDYAGNTLLLRKEALPQNYRINSYDSYYPDSDLDRYLNSVFLSSLENIKSDIVETEIEVTAKDSIGISGEETEKISRQIFILSGNEMCCSSENMAEEGMPLNYFKSISNRETLQNGKKVSCWLRTPNTFYVSCSYVIGDNNKMGFTNASDFNAVRPAFCISGSYPVKKSSFESASGEKRYVLEEPRSEQ